MPPYTYSNSSLEPGTVPITITNIYRCNGCGYLDVVTYNHFCSTGGGKWTAMKSAELNQFYTVVAGAVEVSNKKDKKKMASISDKLRELKMREPDKTLYRHGIISESGELTEAGREAVVEYAFGLVKDQIVADLAQLDKADKAKK